METYLISPEDGLVVRAIHHTESLRHAAALLNCDPGGLFRKVKRIAEDHDLLCKRDGKWKLTPKGHSLLAWTEHSIQTQKRAIQAKTSLRIASTTWFSEQALIPRLKKIRAAIPGLAQVSISVPDGGFENGLKAGTVDLVLVCHAPYDPSIAYKKICPEEWVTITPPSYSKNLAYLKTKPFVHHNELNPSSILSIDFDQTPTVMLDHLVGVRSAVINGLGWSVVPRILVRSALKSKELVEVQSVKPSIQNQVCIWWLRERKDLKTAISAFDQELKTLGSSDE
jgi:DNA-binding transcriptional LysR family regulator